MLKLEMFESLLINPNKWQRAVLDKVLKYIIPFNGPHQFKILTLDKNCVQIVVPYKRINLNHLKGIHACAMATVGEFTAGVSLLSNVGLKKYRIIMGHLECKYFYQGKTNLVSEVRINQNDINKLLEELEAQGKSEICVEAILKDDKNNIVSSVKSTWQLKDWALVKTKI